MAKILFFVILFIMVVSCEKPYDNAPVQNGISNLVVSCIITNDPPPYSLSLVMSSSYNGSGLPSKVRNAKASVIDEVGNVENFIEKPFGTYLTSASGMKGQIGKSYKIKINLIDAKGRITDSYESDFVKLTDVPNIDTIYAEVGQLQTNTKTFAGLNVYIDATPPAGQDYFYKLKTSMIQEIQQLMWPLGHNTVSVEVSPGVFQSFPPPTYVNYMWNTAMVDIPNDLKTNSAQNLTQIRKLYVGFIPEFFSTSGDSLADPPYSNGAITTTEIYSVSKKIFDIFSEENSQIKPVNSIFDPIPTQIESNITCTSNKTRMALGYFAAASVARKFHYFNWVHTGTKIYSHNVDSIHGDFEPSGTDSAVAPVFWINPM